MTKLEIKLKELSPTLSGSFEETKNIVSLLLQKYSINFPSYTDHSINHTLFVLELASNLMTSGEINSLNHDEVYVLCMSCLLHDIGMCIPEEKIKEISNTADLLKYRAINPDFSTERYLRDIHHILSMRFINEEWQMLKIPSEKYAEAIGLVSQGHRKVDLNDFNVYEPQFFVKGGRDFVCLPYLSCILRIADELDITNLRTPEILCKYYTPDGEVSQREWEKHKSTIQMNFLNNEIKIEAKCSDHNILAALEEQFDKIKNVIYQCQKTIRSLHLVGEREYNLSVNTVVPVYKYENFDPKGIKYSFDVKNVINAFVGEDLYEDNTAAIREVVQNAIDSCNYKKSIQKDKFEPSILINVSDNFISVEDNGQGMDEFIIENFFGKLASSFYEQPDIKNEFNAIGQFGIGVFSYFLISDYIDVETKRHNKKSLKFRTDKDPNGYFHFFDDFSREDAGTKIVLHLKHEYFKSFTAEGVSNFIEKHFPYVNIPIEVKSETENVSIVYDDFNLEYYKYATPLFYYRYAEKSEDYEFVTVNIDNERITGVLGIIVPKIIDQRDKIHKYIDFSLQTSPRNAHDASLVSVSQKGVYINDYSSKIHFTIGKIDIKEKLKINLSRNKFSDEKELKLLLEELETLLINKLFQRAKEKLNGINDVYCNYCKDFITSSYFEIDYYSKEFFSAIRHNIYFNFEINSSKVILNIDEIYEQFDKFLIFKDAEEVMRYSEKTDYPILVCDPYNSWSIQYFIERFLQYGYEIVTIEEKNSYALIRASMRDNLV